MKKQPELTAMTRKKLIDTYFELVRKGEKATVGAICELAGYNRCTFYRYFSDTEQLLYEVETEICDAFTKAIPQDSLVGIPTEIIESLAGVYQTYGNYLSVLLGSHGDLQFVSRMKEIIRPIATPIFLTTSKSPAIADLKMEFVMSAVLATVTKWYDMNQPITANQLGMEIKEILQFGIFSFR